MAVKVWRRPFEWTGDTKRHEFLYDAQAIFKILAGISLGSALLFAFNGWTGTAFLVAVSLAVCVLWLVSSVLEHRARHGLPGPTTEGEYVHALAPSASDPEALREREIEQRAARAGTRLALGLLAVLIPVAVIVALLLFDRATLGVGIVLALVWVLVFGAPFWAAAVMDRHSEERVRTDD